MKIKKINTYNTFCICCLNNIDKLCNITKKSCLDLKKYDKVCDWWKFKEVKK